MLREWEGICRLKNSKISYFEIVKSSLDMIDSNQTCTYIRENKLVNDSSDCETIYHGFFKLS
jgi:hypothetical protein